VADELDELLGIDPSDPLHERARLLVESDGNLLLGLAAFRRAAGISETELAARLGWKPGTVRAFERPGADPALSSIRRYALAVGVDYTHNLGPANLA
jgi:hypothetical protein